MGLLGDYLPDWLPADPQKADAMRAGLLQFGAAMMQGRGNLGNILGGGLGAGAQGYSNSLEEAQKRALQDGQLKILKNKDDREQKLQGYLGDAFGMNSLGAGGQPSIASAALGAGAQSGSVGPTNANASRIAALPQMGQPQQQGGFPLTLNQVTGLHAMGGPNMLDAYKYSKEGVKRDQGSTYELPDGTTRSYAKLDSGQAQGPDGTVSNAPGYVDAFTQTEAAKANAQEAAKANYDLVDPTKFVRAGGAPVTSTRGDYVRSISQLPQNGQPVTLPKITQPTAQPSAQSPANFPKIAPSQQLAADATSRKMMVDELATETNPTNQDRLQREIARIDARASAAGGAPVLQSAAEAKAQIGAVDTNLKAGQDLNSNWIKETHNPVQTAGSAARATLTQLETLKNVNFSTGWGAPTKVVAANILATLGIKDAEKYASSAQVFQQVAMERNMTMLAEQKGPQTEGDSQRAQQTFMRLENTLQANQFIADLTGANARIAQRKAAFYNEALPIAKASGDFTEIDRRWSKIAPSVWADPALARYKQGK